MATREKDIAEYQVHDIDHKEVERKVLQFVADNSDGGNKPVRASEIRVGASITQALDELLRLGRLVRGKEEPGVLLTAKGLRRLKDLGGAGDVVPAAEETPEPDGSIPVAEPEPKPVKVPKSRKKAKAAV